MRTWVEAIKLPNIKTTKSLQQSTIKRRVGKGGKLKGLSGKWEGEGGLRSKGLVPHLTQTLQEELKVSGMRMPIVFRFRRLKMRKSV